MRREVRVTSWSWREELELIGWADREGLDGQSRQSQVGRLSRYRRMMSHVGGGRGPDELEGWPRWSRI